MFLPDENYKILHTAIHRSTEQYPYLFIYEHEPTLAFWLRGESEPFMRIRVYKLVVIAENCIEIFSLEDQECLLTLWTWDYWNIGE